VTPSSASRWTRPPRATTSWLLWRLFAAPGQALPDVAAFDQGIEPMIPESLRRSSAFLTHPVFNTHHSETEMLRYIRSLSDKDLALGPQHDPAGQRAR
jgi:glycine dehydrogenase